MDSGKVVWAPHPDHGYIVGKITDIGNDTITVQPFAQGSKVWSNIARLENDIPAKTARFLCL